MRRRHLLTLSASALGGVLVYRLERTPERVQAQTGKVQVPLRFFTEDEAHIIAAAAARIFPNDESGPGANEAGVVIYIDRQLGSPYGRDRYRYAKAPFENGVPEQGYQGKASPREIYREGLKPLSGFDKLPPTEQDERLRAIEKTPFFAMLRMHTIEGMFCDPMHGGNVDKIGWQLIGFPGPRMSNYDEVEAYHGRAFRPKPESLSEILHRPVKPSEDETE
ncbi:MAG: gluconate 2-dehydrogenase subunit 3 family protein [Bryobacteraceae bacterium]